MFVLRIATPHDVPNLQRLIERSVRVLQARDYTEAQIEGALGSVFGVDRQLIKDASYFVAEDGQRLVGCGGWSYRRTLFGADGIHSRDDTLLVPGAEAAKIRAFFVEPGYARQGIGTAILLACEKAAVAAGFTELEMGATLTGVPLYARHGYVAVERLTVPLPNGALLPVVRMAKSVA